MRSLPLRFKLRPQCQMKVTLSNACASIAPSVCPTKFANIVPCCRTVTQNTDFLCNTDLLLQFLGSFHCLLISKNSDADVFKIFLTIANWWLLARRFQISVMLNLHVILNDNEEIRPNFFPFTSKPVWMYYKNNSRLLPT